LPPKSYFFRLWVRLIGDPAHFPLHVRILHSVCFISLFALGYNIPFNYIIGLPEVALVSFLALIVAGFAYYMSRLKFKEHIAVLTVNLTGLALFTSNYFLNSGLGGPTDIFFLLFLLMSIMISSERQYKIWVPINIIALLTLVLVEYYRPDLVPDHYDDRFSRFVDHISAYIVVAAIFYVCISYVRASYEKERNSAEQKSRAIEEKNYQIVKQNQELEKLNSEKNKLMSIVAHDLRSPLGSIQNFLELLTQHDLEEDQKIEIENQLLSSTKNTLSMLTKLLNWSKAQLNGVSAQLEYLNLSNLFQLTIDMERSAAEKKNIDLDFKFDHETVIYADSDMMQLILRNVIGNAIKFTKSGGKVTVRTEITGNDCLISVRDNGIGMSAEKQDKVFSLNVQSTFGTMNEKGVGLGLILCMEFIKAQNGKLWFESIPGEGTTFFISIPLLEETLMWPTGLS
jgi:two-component system, sensor histidine kinase and response regulator